MPYETWAGGTISGGADATSWSLKPRGGYVPVEDIPNAPKTVDMPMLQYPKMPSIRYEPVQGQVDMASRAEKLKQQPLPSSFEEAGALRAQYAGQGQMAMGKAIAGAGQEVSKAVATVGETLARFTGKALEVKDAADELRGNVLHDEWQQTLAGIRANNPPEKWPDMIKEANNKFASDVSHLGTRQVTKDKLAAMVKGSLEMEPIQTQNEGNRYEINQSNQLGESLMRDGLQYNDYAKYNEGVAHLEKTGAYSHENAQEAYSKGLLHQNLHVMDEALKNPDSAIDVANDADAVAHGGKASKYTALNDNPSLAPNVAYEAKEKVKSFQREGMAEINQKIQDRQITDPKQIDQLAKQYHLTSDTADALKAQVKAPVAPFSASEQVRLRNEINNFDYWSDTTPGHEGEKFQKLWVDMHQHIDPENIKHFESLLRAKADDAYKPTSAIDAEHSAVLKTAEERSKLGMTVPKDMQAALLSSREKDKAREEAMKKAVELTGSDRTAGEKAVQAILNDEKYKYTGKEAAARNADAQAVLDAHRKADEFKDKHPNADPGELNKAVFGDDAAPINKNLLNSAGTPHKAPTGEADIQKRIADIRASVPAGSFGQGYTGPRNIRAIGASPQWRQAFNGPGQSFHMDATAFTPGKGDPNMEGPNAVAGRSGPAYTYEAYERGDVPYVSVAMDPHSAMQGQYLVSDAHPGVLFKVEDTGSAFQGKGSSRVDIAFEKSDLAQNYESHGTWKQISPAQAAQINGNHGVVSYSGTGQVNPALLATVHNLEGTFGKLNIISGYRDPETNRKAGGAEHSQHLHGNAVDIATGSMSNDRKLALIYAAKHAGISGIGVYANNLHFDLGPRRAWGPSYHSDSVPAWARGALQDYINA